MKTAISISVAVRKIDSFYKYILAMLHSLNENGFICEGMTKLPIILWKDGLTINQKNKLETIYNNIEFRDIDTELYKKHNKSSAGWYCLEAWKLKEYDKVINLDADFICQGCLKELINFDCKLGMVKEWTGIYNGGLLIISKEYLQGDWYKKLMECDYTKINIGGNRDKFSKDQKLYNYFFKNDIKEIPKKFNHLVSEQDAIGASMVHYVYKPLYDVGRKQLQNINPNLIKLWESYYNAANRI
jgi:hypothetical protein